jgi:hypothetical protein
LLRHAAQSAFFDGFKAGCLVAAGIALAGAAFVAMVLPARPMESLEPEPIELLRAG